MKNRRTFNLLVIATLILIGCNKVEKDWNIANSANTIAEYQKFIENHPKSKFVENAKASIESIHLKDAVEYVIASYIQSTGNLSGFSNVRTPELSYEEKKRLESIGVTRLSFSSQGDIQFQFGSGVINIRSNGYIEAVLDGNIHHKIKIKEGNYRIENGRVVIAEGSKIAINDINYLLEGNRLKVAK